MQARRGFLGALLVAALLLLTGCNVIALKQSALEGTLRSAGLRPGERRLGPDVVHYWAGGKAGPTVLLLHGFGASAIWQWTDQVEELARDHRLIVPDLLWFGDSRSDLPDYGVDHQVRAVEALLDALGETQLSVVGISYGGLVAHELASDRPDQVRRLTLVDTPGRVYTRGDYRALCERLGVSHVGEVLVPRDVEGVQRLLDLAYHDPPFAPDVVLEQTLDAFYASYRDERIALLDTLIQDMDRLEARPLTRKARVQVIWGRDDPVFPLAIGERLATSLKVKVEVIDRARHAPNVEHPELFNRMLRKFLRRAD